MFTCRKELEDLLGLRHPRKVLIEESMEVPRAAERFFRGIYAEPDKLKRGFADLQRETASISELLGLRKSKFRDWLNELPGSPGEAAEYIRETSTELTVRHERAALAEARVLAQLQEQGEVELFPVEEEILSKWSPERILLFPKVIERIALLLKVSADGLNKACLVHAMTHVLLYAGEDRDKRTWARHELGGDGLESVVHYYSNAFYSSYQYKELAQAESVLTRYLPAAGRETRDLDQLSREQVNAAMIFWRRRSDLSLREILSYLEDFA